MISALITRPMVYKTRICFALLALSVSSGFLVSPRRAAASTCSPCPRSSTPRSTSLRPTSYRRTGSSRGAKASSPPDTSTRTTSAPDTAAPGMDGGESARWRGHGGAKGRPGGRQLRAQGRAAVLRHLLVPVETPKVEAVMFQVSSDSIGELA